MISEATALTREQMVAELNEIYTKIYASEPADTYDLAGAREYWNQLPTDQLAAELMAASLRLAKM